MRYDKPKLIPAGDASMIVYMGYGMELEVNSAVIVANRKVLEESEQGNLEGIVDTIPGWYSFAIYYDNQVIDYSSLEKKIMEIVSDVGEIETMPSRIIEIPVLYGTKENGTEWGPDLASSAEYSNLSVEEAVKAHTDCNQWVGLIGFEPGSPFTTPLRKKGNILLGKVYPSPRNYTPAATLGQGGACCAWYNLAGAGGYAVIGSLPVTGYDPTQTLPDFYDSPLLLKAGDRVRYVPISLEEYNKILLQARERTFRFNITEAEFNIKAYLEGDEDDV